MTVESPPASQKFHTIQALRFFAALSVVVMHAGLTADKYTAYDAGISYAAYTNMGHLGVSLFFVISGFIMVLTAYRNAGISGAAADFLKRRLIRIVPLYWLVTAAFVAAKFIHPPLFSTFELHPWHTLASFLFIPATNNAGELTPVVNIGWTLNYEMFFYGCFAIGLALNTRILTGLITIGLPALVLLRFFIPAQPGIILQFVTHPYLLFFVIGFWSGRLYLHQAVPRKPLAINVLLISVAYTAIAWMLFLPTHLWAHVVVLGPLFGVLCWLSAGYETHTSRIIPALFSRLGDSSYSLYLTHIVVLTLGGKLWYGSWFDQYLGPAFFMLILVPLCVAMGHIIYLKVEVPLIGFIRNNTRLRKT